jgi:predicted DNA-binding protein (UPF0251 family)
LENVAPEQCLCRFSRHFAALDKYEHMPIMIEDVGGASFSMPRPSCCRKIGVLPTACRFVPAGAAHCDLEEITLSMDEFEALRLADLEGLYQDAAAQRMGISRQTFGRIIESARHKVAEALVQAKALKIEGGAFVVHPGQTFRCPACRHSWESAGEHSGPVQCPKCQQSSLHSADANQGTCCRREDHAKPCTRRQCCKTKGKGKES